MAFGDMSDICGIRIIMCRAGSDIDLGDNVSACGRNTVRKSREGERVIGVSRDFYPHGRFRDSVAVLVDHAITTTELRETLDVCERCGDHTPCADSERAANGEIVCSECFNVEREAMDHEGVL